MDHEPKRGRRLLGRNGNELLRVDGAGTEVAFNTSRSGHSNPPPRPAVTYGVPVDRRSTYYLYIRMRGRRGFAAGLAEFVEDPGIDLTT